jgi:phosphate transport system protein
MRAAFHAQLDELISDLARMVRVSAQLMTDASSALHRGDLPLAEGVIASEDRMTARLEQVQRRCVILLALQAPVATDLRVLVTALRAVSEVERMAALARHVAKIVRLKHPRAPIADGVAPIAARMSVLTARLAHAAADTMEARDPLSVDRLTRADDELDALRDQLLGVVFGADWPYGVESAVDAALIGRYYERFADHAVALAGQVCYLVTGEYSQPLSGVAVPGPDRSARMLTGLTKPRSPVRTTEEVVEAEGVVLDVARRRAQVDGYVIHFAARETAVLRVLMARAGQVVYRAALADAAGMAGGACAGALDRLMRRLRRRLQPSPRSPARLHRVGDTDYLFGSRPNDTSARSRVP